MYGNLHLPPNSTAISMTEFKGEFTPAGGNTTGTITTHIYNVPQNATFLYLFLVGSGGAGGGAVAGVGASGAGSGSCAAITQGLFPVMLLPKSLIVFVANGAPESAAGSSGQNGMSTEVWLYAPPTGNVAVGNKLLVAGLGSGGINTGAVQAGGSVFTVAAGRWAALGLWRSVAGESGGAGSTTAGAAATFLTTLPLTGGGGGSGSSAANAGGAVNSQAGYAGITTVTGGASGGGNGNVGRGQMRPWGGTGGSGGGSIAGAGVGGNGGAAGWFGCGGGGGGNAQTTGGKGGKGGPGYCLIVAF